MQNEQEQQLKKYDYVLIDSSNLIRRFYEIYQQKIKSGDTNIQPYYVISDGEKIDISPIRNYIKHIHDLRRQFPNSQFYHCFDDPNRDNLKKRAIDPTYKNEERPADYLSLLNKMPSLLAYTLQTPYLVKGYEAESLIFSISTTLVNTHEERNKPLSILIYSNSKSFQGCLVENIIEQCTSFSAQKGAKIVTFNDAKEELGFTPWLKPVHDALISQGVSEKLSKAYLGHSEFNFSLASDFHKHALSGLALPVEKRMSVEKLSNLFPDTLAEKDRQKQFEKLATMLNSLDNLTTLFNRVSFNFFETIEKEEYPENSKKMKKFLAEISFEKFNEVIHKASDFFKISEDILTELQPRNSRIFQNKLKVSFEQPQPDFSYSRP